MSRPYKLIASEVTEMCGVRKYVVATFASRASALQRAKEILARNPAFAMQCEIRGPSCRVSWPSMRALEEMT